MIDEYSTIIVSEIKQEKIDEDKNGKKPKDKDGTPKQFKSKKAVMS